MFKFLIISLIPTISLATDLEASAILAQQGCFHVTYESRETGTFDPTNPERSRYFRTGATELVVADKVSNDEIILQHVTQFEGAGENHWGQVWKRNPEIVIEFQGDLTWKKNAVPDSQGKWSQYVTQVDMSPRYDCAAGWQIQGNVREWACRSWSPLPRREYGRKDYNVLERNNRHIITHDGWIHHQENRKILVQNGKVIPVATELTINTYDRLPMSECSVASAHWSKQGPTWSLVRDAWSNVIDPREVLKFHGEVVNGKTLWMKLFELVAAKTPSPTEDIAFKQSISDAISEYLVEEKPLKAK